MAMLGCLRPADAILHAGERDLYRILERFFSVEEYLEMRELQKTYGLIISGSAALQLFEHKAFMDSDLDLYTSCSSGPNVIDWLEEIGYMFMPSKSHTLDIKEAFEFAITHPYASNEYGPEGTLSGISGVFCFRRSACSQEVQVIVANEPIPNIVLKFHSSKSCTSQVNIAYNITTPLSPSFHTATPPVSALPLMDSGSHEHHFLLEGILAISVADISNTTIGCSGCDHFQGLRCVG